MNSSGKSSGLLQYLIDQQIEKLNSEMNADFGEAANAGETSISSLSTRLVTSAEETPETEQSTLSEAQKQLQLLVGRPPLGAQTTWFIGPGGGNLEQLKKLSNLAIDVHKEFRLDGIGIPYDDDGEKYSEYFSDVAQSHDYKLGMDVLSSKLLAMVRYLNQGSVPFQRFGYIAHMNWDNTLPGVLGWIVGVLYNQNNIAAEASPLTTLMEIDVSRQLCNMIGFANTPPVVEFGKKDEFRAEHDVKKVIPWGKITCDGSVANIESVWMARNFRFFSLAFHNTLIEEASLALVRRHDDTKVIPTGQTTQRYFIDLTAWEVINLVPKVFFDLLDRIARLLTPEMNDDISDGHAQLHALVEKRDVRALGLVDFVDRHSVVRNIPRVITPSSRHYSWPKAVTSLGLGSNSLVNIPVGMDARMDMVAFRRAVEELVEKRIPILLAVSVHGSTVEGAVDDLDEILKIRESVRAKGADFLVHVDAAWGGYFQAMLQEPDDTAITLSSSKEGKISATQGMDCQNDNRGTFGKRALSPVGKLKPSIVKSFEALKHADSITVDPHKSGYVPYPSGGLLLKDSRLRERIAVRAPIVFKGESDPTVSWYGLEGSRAGAAAVATWFTHQLVPLDRQGYGEILGKCLFNSTLIYAGLHFMAEKSRDTSKPEHAYFVTTIPMLDGTFDENSAYVNRLMTEDIQDLKSLLEKDKASLGFDDVRFRGFIEELGSDTAIISYIFTPAQFINGEFVPNADIRLSNKLNTHLYDKYSILEYVPQEHKENQKPDLILSSSEYGEESHGEDFVNRLKDNMGVQGDGSINALVTTTMNPWFLDAPETIKKSASSPFKRKDTISYVLGMLDSGVKRAIGEIS